MKNNSYKSKNINTKEYWDARFSTKDWEKKYGRLQTKSFAEEQCKFLKIPKNFKGVITDFGCGLGDAFPVYRKNFPFAILNGYDISSEAIFKCREMYGSIASFYQGTAADVKWSDVIISSNVFEHISDNDELLKTLLNKCSYLYVVVPYNEEVIDGTEHVNTYDENSFPGFNKDVVMYYTRGNFVNRLSFIFNIYIKNIIRPLFGRKIVKKSKQIMFIFVSGGS